MEQENLKLKVSASPHVRSKATTSDIMFDVVIALVPATAFGLYIFGWYAALLVAVCIGSCVGFEALYQKCMGKKVTVGDFSAVVTGLLLALNLPPNLPIWMAIAGSAFAIIIVKQLFGGLGQNFMNPALGARCFLLLSFSRYMTNFVYDGVATATPLATLKLTGMVNLRSMFLGYTAAKKFQLKPMLGLAIGAAMCYPGIQLSALSAGAEAVTTVLEGTLFQSPVYIDFFGIPVISVDYTGTVIPVILTVWFASKCEKLFNRFVPDLVKFFFVPMLTLLVTLPVAMIFLGPVATFGSTLISEFTLMIREFSPLLAGAVVGFTWQILVIFGMHWGFIPVYINNVQTLGYDNVMMPFFACTFATSAVVLAMFFKTKDKR